MSKAEGAESRGSGSDTLLLEILGVLKRIDGHLESQGERIQELDAKVTRFAPNEDTRQRPVPNARSKLENRINTLVSSTPRKDSSTSPSTKRHQINLQANARNGSLASRASHDSSRHSLATGTFEQGARFGKFRRDSTKTVENGSNKKASSQDIFTISGPKIAPFSRSETWNSQLGPPTADEIESVKLDTESADPATYSKYPPPQKWIVTRSQTPLDVKYDSKEARHLWTAYVGDSWTIPPDGRIEMTFQQHILERLDKDQVTSLLETLQDVSCKLEYQNAGDLTKRGSFRVTDYGFDPNFEESVAEYRADVLTGQYKKHPIKFNKRFKPQRPETESAPWKRVIEVRGLSRQLIDGHETWTSNFRNPFNEALPVVNSVCPFITARIGDSEEKNPNGKMALDTALLNHQYCWRRPASRDDDLYFHITFYELVDLTREDELEGEMWRSGRLHSDNEKELEALFGVKTRRIRESACTIVAIPDTKMGTFWTLLYLCPNNFELYDKSNNYESYDTITSAIKNQNASGVVEVMIEFTIRMVIERWLDIAEYFARLIGHRDTLSDPDAHDSLLFDDDSFSRSRRYFWAINYLAELDLSISGNIAQLEKFARRYMDAQNPVRQRQPGPGWPHTNAAINEQLDQLQYLRERLQAQREEAIALRDGLFSASGVMESRASTRLGENIKLLTFVSIFFLPLSFCMSLWSINDSIFSLKALIIVVILVGLGTYLIVLNLNNVVGLCARLYDKWKNGVVERMTRDENSNWSEAGKRFATFQPKHEKLKPSDWTLGLFVLRGIFRGLGFKKRTERKGKEGLEARAVSMGNNWPNLSFSVGFDTQRQEKEPAETEASAKEKASPRSGLASFSKVFRRGALSKGISTDV